ncbi:hypothetical protein LX32DRAFT_298253 [Colletotrichum zoysiae]|uniref:Uncharacterized protein n=1 Tax=Colletotrichum zoysiae TaxID=1216348 RepID=A0AAD9H264_9PEZI|nr:hypothetical protein LX32DRAFT_298253 [Colletotrichum zoysiae]
MGQLHHHHSSTPPRKKPFPPWRSLSGDRRGGAEEGYKTIRKRVVVGLVSFLFSFLAGTGRLCISAVACKGKEISYQAFRIQEIQKSDSLRTLHIAVRAVRLMMSPPPPPLPCLSCAL